MKQTALCWDEGSVAFQTYLMCVAHGGDRGMQVLYISPTKRLWFSRRITLSSGGADTCSSLNWVYSIPVNTSVFYNWIFSFLCFIFGHKDNHWAAFSDPLEVVLPVMQEAEMTMANSLQRNFSSFRTKCTDNPRLLRRNPWSRTSEKWRATLSWL